MGRWSDQKGSALIIIFLMLIPLSLALMALASLAPTLMKKAKADEDRLLALHTAESGLQYAIAYAKKNGINAAAALPKTEIDGGGEYLITSSSGKLISTGWYPASSKLKPGEKQRQHVLQVSYTSLSTPLEFTKAAFVLDRGSYSVNFLGARVQGDIYLSNPTTNSIKVSGTTLPGEIYRTAAVANIIESDPWDKIEKTIHVIAPTKLPDILKFPAIPGRSDATTTLDIKNSAYTLMADAQYNVVRLSGSEKTTKLIISPSKNMQLFFNTFSVENGTVAFQPNGYTIDVYMDTLSISGVGKITVTGDGKVRLYIRTGISLSGDASINPGTFPDVDPGFTTMEPRPLNQHKPPKGPLQANIFVNRAPIESNGSTYIKGCIISNYTKVSLTDDNTVVDGLIYAPLAEVYLKTKFNGAIVCNTLATGWTTYITFDDSKITSSMESFVSANACSSGSGGGAEGSLSFSNWEIVD